MPEFAKHAARPAATVQLMVPPAMSKPQNTGGLITPGRFLAITQTGQSIKLVPMGTLPQSNQHMWVLDHADGSDGACLSAPPLSLPGTRYLRSSGACAGACCSGRPRNGAISCARVDSPLVPRRKFGIDYELYCWNVNRSWPHVLSRNSPNSHRDWAVDRRRAGRGPWAA